MKDKVLEWTAFGIGSFWIASIILGLILLAVLIVV